MLSQSSYSCFWALWHVVRTPEICRKEALFIPFQTFSLFFNHEWNALCIIYRAQKQADLKLVDFHLHNLSQKWRKERQVIIFYPRSLLWWELSYVFPRISSYDIYIYIYYISYIRLFIVIVTPFYSFSGICPDLRHISNGRVIDTSPSIKQASVEFRCNKNFRLVGRQRLKCIDGRWNGMLPLCESKLSLQ